MKILLAENDRWLGQQLKAALTAERYIVDWVMNGISAIDLALHDQYDLLLLNLTLPQVDGLTICRQVRKHDQQIPILILTSLDCDQDLVNALEAGADDLIEKFRSPLRLVAKTRAVMRRQNGWFPAASHVLTWGALCLDPTLVQVTYKQELVMLTRKEYNLLEMFLKSPQRLFSRDDIINRLWTMNECPSKAAVTNLVKDLRRKLKAVGMEEELIETVHGMGYRLMSAPIAAIEHSIPVATNYFRGSELVAV